MQKKPIFITGASGLLGSAALVHFSKKNPVIGTYLHHRIELDGAVCHILDLRDQVATREFLNNAQPELIIHTAAAVDVDACEKNHAEAYSLNVEAVRGVAEYAAKHKTKLVYISTDAFFEGTGKLFSETDAPTPVNYYGETKLLGEEVVRKICPDYLIVRTNLYGWNYQPKFSLAEWMLTNLAAKKTTPLVYDVHYTPILTNTLVECIDELVQSGAQGIFHVAGSRSISKLDFGRLLCKAFHLDESFIKPTSVKELSFVARRSSNMALSIEKLRQALPKRQFSLEGDLQKFKELLLSGYVTKLKGKPFQISLESLS